MNLDGKLRVHQEAGARLSGVMGKGKGEAWAPATLFISHKSFCQGVLLSRPDATASLTDRLPPVLDPARQPNTNPVSHSPRNCGKLAPPGTIGAVAQSGERRPCTAEVGGSNPLGSTAKNGRFAG